MAGTGVLTALSEELAAAVATASRSVVAIHARRRIPASGVVWRPGVVVAANHTIRRDQDIEVTLADGRRAGATLAGRDPGTDLAVLRVPDATEPATLGASDDLAVGNLVLALGRPGRDATASLGVVSAASGEWQTWQGGRIDRFVRLDIAIYDGFSGGALVDASGRTLGINSSGLARAAAVAVPRSTVDRVATEILDGGGVRYGYLGVGLQPVRLPVGAVAGREQTLGLVVVSLEPAAPAAQAGVLMGDIVIGVNGAPIDDPHGVFGSIRATRAGQTIRLELIRGGAVTDVHVTAAARG